MTLVELAYKLRPYIEKAAVNLADEDALEAVQLFPAWNCTSTYAVGDRVRYNGILHRCITTHSAQEAWNPADAPSLWAKVLTSVTGEILAWEQPDSTNPYMKGDKATHNGKTWVSDVDSNVWEPGVYGWTEVVD